MEKKKNFRITSASAVVAVAILFTIGGCKKLDEKVYSTEVKSNYYANGNEVVAAYVYPYSFLQTSIYAVQFTIEEFPTDEAVAPNWDNQDYSNGEWIRFHQHQWNPQEDFIQYQWSNLFQDIGYCNNFIDDIQSVKTSGYTLPIPVSQMVAEVKLVRALNYYWALSEFGNVPIVEHTNVKSPPNNTRAEVFAFIESEIKNNIAALGEKGDATWYGHFTKTAAYALLAKLYLNAQVFTGTQRWSDCAAACDQIINSGKYQLDSTWNTPFLAHNEGSKENILVVPFDANYQPGFNAVDQQLWGDLIQKYNLSNYPWSKIVTQESFFDLYSANDARINQWLVGAQYYTDANGNQQPIPGWYDQTGNLVITPHIDKLNNPSAGFGQGVNNVKYEIQSGTLSNPIGDEMNNDLVVFRLSDIIMMKAECLMRENGGAAGADAIALVNSVRARSFKPGATGSGYTTQTLTLDELLNERGREFSYEMKRREDLIRFGHFEDAWWEKTADANKDHELYPIPANILTSNPALKQNPGY